MVRDYLREVEFRRELRLEYEGDLLLWISVRGSPTSQLQRRDALPNTLSEFVRVFYAARWPNRPITPQNRQRLETVRSSPCGEHEAVIKGMFARQEGNHPRRAEFAGKVGGQMVKVFLLGLSHSAIGQEEYCI